MLQERDIFTAANVAIELAALERNILDYARAERS